MVCGNVVTIVTKQDEITNDNNIDIKSLFAHLIPQQGEMDFIMQLFVSFTILKTITITIPNVARDTLKACYK